MYYIPCAVTVKHEHNQQSNFQSSQVLCKFVAVDQPTHIDIMCKYKQQSWPLTTITACPQI